MTPHLRVARPTDRLTEITRMYSDGLGFQVLSSFEGHGGFDGVMLGHRGAGYHLEFTTERDREAGGAPSPEHLLIFYLPDTREWTRACSRAETAGFRRVASHNPYWDRSGATYADCDGYRVVLQNADWPLA